MVFTQRPGRGQSGQSNGNNRPNNEPYMNSSPSRAMTGPIHPQSQDPYQQQHPYGQDPYNRGYFDPRMQDPRMNPYGQQQPFSSSPYEDPSAPQNPYGRTHPQNQQRSNRPDDLKGLSFWREEDDNGYYDGAEESIEKSSPLKFIIAITGLVIVSGLLWLGYRFATQSESEVIPLIAAEQGPYKRRPDNPGGMAFPHQEMLVYGRLSPQQQNGQPVERIMPEQEQYYVPQDQGYQDPNMQQQQMMPEQQQMAPVDPSQMQNYPQQTVNQQQPQVPVNNQQPSNQAPQMQQQPTAPVAQPQQQAQAPEAPIVKDQKQPAPGPVAGSEASQAATPSAASAPQQPDTSKKADTATSSKKTEVAADVKAASEVKTEAKAEKAKEKKAAAPVDVIKTTLEPGYYMQLASLPSEASAKKELSRLRQKYKDITPIIQPFETGVKKFHRVMVGPFSDRDVALKKCVSIGNGCKVIQISQSNG